MATLDRQCSRSRWQDSNNQNPSGRSSGKVTALRECPFCSAISGDRIFHTDELVLGLWDGFPVSHGHALLIPRRHIATWFDATEEEQAALMRALAVAREKIMDRWQPDGFNIGINAGEAAGQTVFHLHVHLIPRYKGDVRDPRGGVRHVIPSKANYLEKLELPGSNNGSTVDPIRPDRALVEGVDDPLLPHLLTGIDQSTQVNIAAAFILPSGVRRIERHLQDLLDRGGTARLLTGDYLDVTDPDALLRLLDLRGNFQLRVYETEGTSFHPKAYLFHERSGAGVAYVGSSNLTETALTSGVEWNYRVISSPSGGKEFHQIVDAYDRLFTHPSTRSVDIEWITNYRERRKAAEFIPHAYPVEIEEEPSLPVPEPHSVQVEALIALENSRLEGNAAGLVVLATGLGKTWLSAFDSNRPEYRRILFVAHREEILAQAAGTFRNIRPTASLGLYTGQEKSGSSEVVFASIQTLGRKRHLENFSPQEFDYIVVDEFHHASAPTYRRLIEYFKPKFLLGLTATPERTDGGDLLALCGENLVYRCDLFEGIRRDLLSPFHYYGVPDEVDYTNIHGEVIVSMRRN